MNGHPEELHRRISASGIKHIEIAKEIGIGYAQLNQKLLGKRAIKQEEYDLAKRAFIRVAIRQIETIAKNIRGYLP
jgi:hypothetical protein